MIHSERGADSTKYNNNKTCNEQDIVVDLGCIPLTALSASVAASLWSNASFCSDHRRDSICPTAVHHSATNTQREGVSATDLALRFEDALRTVPGTRAAP